MEILNFNNFGTIKNDFEEIQSHFLFNGHEINVRQVPNRLLK